MIPPNTLAALQRYVEHGIPTGGFLNAVLSNELFEAMGRADWENRAALFEIVQFIYNELPSTCHGSPAKVAAWLAVGEERLRAVTP